MKKKQPKAARSAEIDLEGQQAAAVPPVAVPEPETVETPAKATGRGTRSPKRSKPLDACTLDIKRMLDTHGPQYFDTLRSDPLRLASVGMTADQISPQVIRSLVAEMDVAKQAIHADWAAANADPDRKLNIVVQGHPVLDPDKNPDHPVQGEAWLEKSHADEKKKKTDERIGKLRARKQQQSDYNDPTPETLSHNDEGEHAMATATKTTKALKISEADAKKVLAAVGLASDDAPVKKVQTRIDGLADMAKDADFVQPETPAEKKLLKTILAALGKGQPVEIGGSNGHAEKNGHAGKNGKAPKAEKKAKATAAAHGRKAEVAPGTITREYKGKEHKVKAKSDGTFDYDGKPYSSLTQVAKMITGAASINGPKFFGVTK